MTPAALNAAAKNGRSAVSQRADEAASGRITPTWIDAADTDVAKPVAAIAKAATAAMIPLRLFRRVMYYLSRGSHPRPNLL